MKIMLSVALGVLTATAFAQPTYNGMSYCSWWEEALSQPGSDQSLTNMRHIGVDTVAINVWEFQDDENATEIAPDYSRYSSSESSLRHAIRVAKSLGMKVVLKPNVDLRNGSWRAGINPSVAWFTAYEAFISKYARIGQEEGAEMLSIGTEFINTESWAESWRNVASAARSEFDGKITYASNHGSEQNIAWWDAVDIIGIDAYYVLSTLPEPSLNDLQAAWFNRANSIESWLVSASLNKSVLFTEVGYRSADTAASAPWDYTTPSDPNLQLQADCYEALLGEMTTRSWWAGAMWWNWETDPNAGGLLDSGFTPQSKPAEDVLRAYYNPVPETSTFATIALGIAALSYRRRRNSRPHRPRSSYRR